MYRSSRLRSSLNTGYITGLGMCEVCTEAVHCAALWTRTYITGLGMCEVCTEAVGCVVLCIARVWLQVWACVEVCTEAVHCVALWTRVTLQVWHVWSMYRSSRLRSTLNTGYITGLGMCEVCTEAVDCVVLWTRVTLQVWACVKYVPKQSIA